MAKDITIKNPEGTLTYYPKTVSELVYDNTNMKNLSLLRKDDYNAIIEKLGTSGTFSQMGFTLYKGCKPTYNESTNTITFSSGDNGYYVYALPITKGVIYRVTATSAVNRTLYIAYTQNTISSANDILSSTFDNVTVGKNNTQYDLVSIAPYSGFLIFYHYNTQWTGFVNYLFDWSSIPEEISSVVTNVNAMLQEFEGTVNTSLTKYLRQYDKNSQTYNALLTNLDYSKTWEEDGVIEGYSNFTTTNRVYNDVYYNATVQSRSSAEYVTRYKHMNKGEVIRVYGQSSNSTARGVYIGMCSTVPEVGSSLTYCLNESFPQSAPNTMYYVVPEDGYVTLYYYNASWVGGHSPEIKYCDFSSVEPEPEPQIATDEYLDLIQQAHFLNYTDTPAQGETAVLGLVHFSDFHEDAVAGNLLMDYVNKYGDYINDVICTGDVVLNSIDQNNPNTYFEITGLSDSLFVLGNHDQAKGTNVTTLNEYFWTNAAGILSTVDATIAASHEYSYNKYFDPFVDYWGVTMPTGFDVSTSPYYQACYWCKDYGDQKIRIIGIDDMYRFDGIVEQDNSGEFVRDTNNMFKVASGGEGLAKATTEQETWVYDRMLDTLDSNNSVYGYSVIILSHYMLDDIVGSTTITNKTITSDGTSFSYPCNEGGGLIKNQFTNLNSCFNNYYMPHNYTNSTPANMRNRVQDITAQYGYRKGNFNIWGEMVKMFMEKSGKFICWLCGHTHRDFFFYPNNYPNILNICINQAGCTRTQNQAARPVTSKSRLCANYIAVNSTEGTIKIVRLGLNRDKNLRPIKFTHYDYINRRIISEG